MKTKKIFKIGMLLMLGVLVLGASVPALAVNDNPAPVQQGIQKMDGSGNNWATDSNQFRGRGQRAQTMINALSELIGEDLDSIRAERQAGKTIREIAEESGIESDAITDKVVEMNQSRLQDRLDHGVIDQVQYDNCLQQMDQRIQERLDSTANCNSDGFRGRGRGNGRGQGQGRGHCW